MRIAWIGPMVNSSGGASGVSALLLEELGQRGIYVDCYLSGRESAVPEKIREQRTLRFICHEPAWKWGSWYSHNNFVAFVTGQAANLYAENWLAKELLKNHRQQPYDLIYQFSHIELSILRRYTRQLPPVVLHPSVHAAGELRWHRLESAISRSSERPIVRLGVRMMLTLRVWIQKRHIKIPTHILGLSKSFARNLVEDYGVPPRKIRVLPNPIDLQRFTPKKNLGSGRKFVILFVSRIAVRKGVDMIVDLSHRLTDIADEVDIRVVGNKSLWSDYTSLLKSLNPHTSTYIGEVQSTGSDMVEVYQQSDMLIQPSKYEPFGLTVGEALACGIPVVTSDIVGASEGINPLCCRRFSVGDMDALEREVRRLLEDIKTPRLAHDIARVAREEAERVFSGSVVTGTLIDYLDDFVEQAENSPLVSSAGM